MKNISKSAVKVTPALQFGISVPLGTEKVVLKKELVRKLLQSYCNLEVHDFMITSNGKFEIMFTDDDVK